MLQESGDAPPVPSPRVEYSQIASGSVLAERWICDERARKVCTPPQWASIKAVKARALKSKSPSPK